MPGEFSLGIFDGSVSAVYCRPGCGREGGAKKALSRPCCQRANLHCWNMGAIKLTREELYKRVWSTPVTRLALEFGISDVAVAKTCRRMNVPRPPKGYWARIEAGQKPPKPKLPKMTPAKKPATPPLEKPIPVDPFDAENYHPPVSSAGQIRIPISNSSLHPFAQEILVALQAEAPDTEQFVSIRGSDVPSLRVSKRHISKIVRAIHVILMTLEPYGLVFKKAKGRYSSPSFQSGYDKIEIAVEELIETIRREPTELDKRHPSWQWQLEARQPSGRFKFTLRHNDGYGKIEVYQKADESAEEILKQVINQIGDFFAERNRTKKETFRTNREIAIRRQDERAVAEERAKVEAIENEKRMHAGTLARLARRRIKNLHRAAEWWRLRCTVEEFIATCTQRWEADSIGLNSERKEWIDWAHSEARGISPLEEGYPDPTLDGPFNPDAIPLGGPYPSERKVARPPTMPKSLMQPKSEPAEDQQEQSSPPQIQSKPYPFWLKYQR